jgi:hypothetical protein
MDMNLKNLYAFFLLTHLLLIWFLDPVKEPTQDLGGGVSKGNLLSPLHRLDILTVTLTWKDFFNMLRKCNCHGDFSLLTQ